MHPPNNYFMKIQTESKKMLSSALTIISFTYGCIAQNSNGSIAFENQKAKQSSSVVLIHDTATIAPVVPRLNYINPKAVKYFKKTFKAVRDEQWYGMRDGWRVNFEVDHVTFRVDYDKKGYWLHTVRCYGEERLAEEVKSLVKSNYPDYAIRLVEEIENPGCITVYVIHLEGKAYWINIVVCDTEFSELEKSDKY
jgi:hypothetical protein